MKLRLSGLNKRVNESAVPSWIIRCLRPGRFPITNNPYCIWPACSDDIRICRRPDRLLADSSLPSVSTRTAKNPTRPAYLLRHLHPEPANPPLLRRREIRRHRHSTSSRLPTASIQTRESAWLLL